MEGPVAAAGGVGMQPPAARSEADGTGEHGRVRYAKPSEWAAQKDIIKRLYLDENKTLDEVRRVMADAHQFYATPSMYKKRIRAWHFSKKLEDEDVLEVLQKKLERKAAGETTHNLVIRGRVVRNQRLRRFLERRPDVLTRLQARTDSFVSVGSPSSPYPAPTQIPKVRSLSPEFRDMERTISEVCKYVRVCAFGPQPSWVWTPAGYTSRNREITDLRGSRTDMLRAVDEFYRLQSAIDHNKPPKVIFQLLNSTLNHLSGAIRTELPDFIFQVVEILQHKWSNHKQLSEIFRRHVVDLGVILLGREHPLSILWIHMLRENEENANVLAQKVLDVLLEELLRAMGPQDHMTCVALDYAMRFVIYKQGAMESWRRFSRWLAAYPNWDDLPNWSMAVRSRLEVSNDPTVEPKPHVGSAYAIPSAAMEYRGIIPEDDFRSRYLLPYLAGRIAIRNGDAERAEGWFLKAKDVAMRIPDEVYHITDFYPKAFTNLHVLYTATKQDKKLKALHDELEEFKARVLPSHKWPRKLLPADCSGCDE